MTGIQEIIANYIQQEDDRFNWVNYGYQLDRSDLQRRFLIQSLLQCCNYGCEYCPFAKRTNTAAELAQDKAELDRFVNWVSDRNPTDKIGILFTPWGEALIHRYYQSAIARLSQLSQVTKVAIQTNLACTLDWVKNCDLDTLALWTTFHPTEVSIESFLQQCQSLDRSQVKYSVGIVGLKEHQNYAKLLRQELNTDVYLWVNAYKRQPDYYNPADIDLFTQIDPLFPINNRVYDTFGKPCRTGDKVITVDGEGTMRRCHFIPDSIGNIYDLNIEKSLFSRNCQNRVCRCHIGYIHLEELNLDKVYNNGILERIPSARSRAF
jgi:MoaA/NifB/PqqE/SkfB family radical SAM enzyme